MAGNPRVTVVFPECGTGLWDCFTHSMRWQNTSDRSVSGEIWRHDRKLKVSQCAGGLSLSTWYSLDSPEKALLSRGQDLKCVALTDLEFTPTSAKCWEESPNEEFSRLGWPVGLSMGVCLDCWLMQEDPECGWHRFMASVLDSLRVEKASWVADNEGSLRLCSSLWGRCDCLCEFLPWFPCRNGLRSGLWTKETFSSLMLFSASLFIRAVGARIVNEAVSNTTQRPSVHMASSVMVHWGQRGCGLVWSPAGPNNKTKWKLRKYCDSLWRK